MSFIPNLYSLPFYNKNIPNFAKKEKAKTLERELAMKQKTDYENLDSKIEKDSKPYSRTY